jgi:uncharacterized protein GlcG (DUF336 family)
VSRILRYVSFVVLASAFAAPASAQLIARKDLSMAIAKTLVETSIDACKKMGYNTSAVVVDRAGETMVAMRGDNASPHTMENARRKAYTARSFRQTTAEYAKKYAEGNKTVMQQVTLPNVIAIPGGVPIKVGDDVIGGVGLSGSPGKDDECVEAGMQKVAGQLK